VTPDELVACLRAVGWSATRAATMAGYARDTGTGWRTGRSVVPPRVASWLRRLAGYHEACPPPRRKPGGPGRPASSSAELRA
jgi:hypothetical protein